MKVHVSISLSLFRVSSSLPFVGLDLPWRLTCYLSRPRELHPSYRTHPNAAQLGDALAGAGGLP